MSAGDLFELRHPAGATRIRVGDGIVPAAIAEEAGLFEGRAIFAITSPEIVEHHGAALAPLAEAGAAFTLLDAADGEAAKSLSEAGKLWDRLAAGGGKRDSLVVAFGGGAIGDLAGFVAATYLRGVRFVQIPTSLLAQIDAAIGGKTGIDIQAGKNLVGAFHQPELVIADTSFLATLPPGQLRSGLVEAIKMAALLDLDLLARIEGDLAALLLGDAAKLAPVVSAAAAAKARLVESDPFEAGDRMLLNYGHTLGHAIEAEAGYGRMLHGDAVAWGMRFANRLARRRGADGAFLDRVEALLDRLDVPAPPPVDAERVEARMARDKKAREAGLTWVLPVAPGRGARVSDLTPAAVRGELGPFLASIAAAPDGRPAVT